jgi:aminoglycoside N3'-acetyltransferase
MHTTAQLTEQLTTLGIESGDVMLVHTSFGRVAPVEGGPGGLIDALAAAAGPRGTVVMPTMASDDDRPFDPTATSCIEDMGVVADTFWRRPGVLRSDSPHAFAALGPQAETITAPHPVETPHGIDSPVGRVHDLDGKVLLLGTGHDANTTIHLAENMAGVRYRRPKYVTVLQGGQPSRLEYAEIDHCCQNFSFVGEWLTAKGLQRQGRIGNAIALLARSRHIVDVAVARLRGNETVFLHTPGVDAECDEARASMPN